MTARAKLHRGDSKGVFVAKSALGDVRREAQEVLKGFKNHSISVEEAEKRLRKQARKRSVVDWILSY